jgi:putative toxin-antitoxin system antitoxin component (TIGR02293 family)
MKEKLNFYDIKTRKKFSSSEWRIETKFSKGKARYFAVAKAPGGKHEAWRLVSAAMAGPQAPALAPLSGSGEPYRYAALVGVKASTLDGLIEKVEKGLPFSAFERLAKILDTSLSALADVIRIPMRTLNRRKKNGFLTHEESERVMRLSRITHAAFGLFEGDREAARMWMGKKNRALGGQTPLAMSSTEIGGEEVLNLIGRLEHGVFS